MVKNKKARIQTVFISSDLFALFVLKCVELKSRRRNLNTCYNEFRSDLKPVLIDASSGMILGAIDSLDNQFMDDLKRGASS